MIFLIINKYVGLIYKFKKVIRDRYSIVKRPCNFAAEKMNHQPIMLCFDDATSIIALRVFNLAFDRCVVVNVLEI